MALGVGCWVFFDLDHLLQWLRVLCWYCVLVDLVQLHKGLGVWFRVVGVGWGVWCLLMGIGCWVLGVWCWVLDVWCWLIFSIFLSSWVRVCCWYWVLVDIVQRGRVFGVGC